MFKTTCKTVRKVNRLLKPISRDRFPLLANETIEVFYICGSCGGLCSISRFAYRHGVYCYRLSGVKGWFVCSESFVLIDNDERVLLSMECKNECVR